jgi:predicted cupin superfamily sugar epimerase
MKIKKMNKEKIVKELNLEPNVEGGYFRRTYESSMQIAPSYDLTSTRPCSTAIYFLLGLDDISRLHMMKTDEIIHFYDGLTLTMFVLDASKPEHFYTVKLGRNVQKGEVYQTVAPLGHWFGFMISEEDKTGEYDFNLIGTTVSPGFDYRDFKFGDRETLLKEYSGAAAIINRLV